MCSPRVFFPQLPELWRRAAITIADTSHGETINELALEILRSGPTRFALAGHSLGGYVALEVVRIAPERVDRLALVSTSARPDTPDTSARRLTSISLAESGRFSDIAERFFHLTVHQSRRDDEQLLAVRRAMAEEVGAEAYVRQQRAAMSRPDARPALDSIRCPTLVMHGDSDQAITVDNGRELAASIRRSRFLKLAACGHAATLECPTETTIALCEWLDA
jgi:pimeloyl-ACP methyl ester carboxylesterase